MGLPLFACTESPSLCPPEPKGEVVYVVEHGWHVDIGIPVELLNADMEFFRGVFPGAKAIMFGYGRKTIFTAPAVELTDYLIGPFPGNSVIQAVGINVLPDSAYRQDQTYVLAMPEGGAERVSKGIWADLSKDDAGKPIVVADSDDPVGRFYKADSTYSLFHSCNTWAAERLEDAGLPVSDEAIMFSGQVRRQVETIAHAQCSP